MRDREVPRLVQQRGLADWVTGRQFWNLVVIAALLAALVILTREDR